MSLQGFYTTKGLALAAKIAAGTKLTITKVTAGSGTTGESASALAQERQTLAVGTAETGKQTATLPVTLAEVNVSAAYSLTELGVYAQDPDAGVILFQVFRMDTPVPLTASGENAYRFYLKQTVGAAGITVTCSPAGLLIDEDLAPTRGKVQAVRVPSRSVTVAAAELAAYIAALPRLLTESISITLTNGVCGSRVFLNNFYGSGSITINAPDGTACSFPKGIEVRDCKSFIILEGLSVSSDTASGSQAAIGVSNAIYLDVNKCSIDANGSEYAVSAYNGTHLSVRKSEIKNASSAALLCGYTSVANIVSCTAENNTAGAYVYHGGIVLLADSTPDTLGGSANKKSGGLILKANGTLL